MKLNDASGQGRESALPPIADIAAEIREGTTVDDLCKTYRISRSTLQNRFQFAGYSLATGEQHEPRHNRPAPLQSQHVGAGGQHVGGGDYQGLPTTPVKYRDKPSRTGIDWDQVRDNYLANGGQIDDTVWPKIKGEVVVMGARGRTHRSYHTIEEADGTDFNYDNQLAQGAPKQRRTTRALDDDQCRAIALKYRRDQVSIRDLADEYHVSTSAIHTALRHVGEPTRSVAEANRLRTKSAS